MDSLKIFKVKVYYIVILERRKSLADNVASLNRRTSVTGIIMIIYQNFVLVVLRGAHRVLAGSTESWQL